MFNVREPRDTDINFILNSWLKSNRHQYTLVTNEVYYSAYRQHVIRLLQQSQVLVACNQEDHDQIYGYIVVEGDTCHYCYVKYPYRKMGLAKALAQHLPFRVQSCSPKKDSYCNLNILIK